MGDCLTVEQVAEEKQHKMTLGLRSGATVVDMESYWIALEAKAGRVPWLALRAIVDPIERSLPSFVTSKKGSDVSDWIVPALKYAATNPSGVLDLLWLGLASRRARRSLKFGATAILPALVALGAVLS
jgi:nucleoside phosphorylase